MYETIKFLRPYLFVHHYDCVLLYRYNEEVKTRFREVETRLVSCSHKNEKLLIQLFLFLEYWTTLNYCMCVCVCVLWDDRAPESDDSSK